MSETSSSQRLVALDALRGIAVLLAMADHLKIQFVPDVHLLVPLTRLATPSFVILFGMMIEIAYLSKLRKGTALPRIRGRLTSRMLICAALFAGLTLAATVSGNLSFQQGLLAVTGMGPGRFSEILLIYTVLFAVVIALLPALRRYGSLPVLVLAGLAWCLKLTLDGMAPQSGYPLTLVTGVGLGYGPALLPSMTFLGFGLAIGEVLTGRRNIVIPVLMLAVAVVICLTELSGGPMEAGRRFLANRWLNHPGYYAVGIVAFVGLGLCLQLSLSLPHVASVTAAFATIGTQSLLIYGGGNLVLNLLPTFSAPHPLGLTIALLAFGGIVVFGLKRGGTLTRRPQGKTLSPPAATP
ncbi:OpgC domain-containing protein [Martelella sp. FOR1707]